MAPRGGSRATAVGRGEPAHPKVLVENPAAETRWVTELLPGSVPNPPRDPDPLQRAPRPCTSWYTYMGDRAMRQPWARRTTGMPKPSLSVCNGDDPGPVTVERAGGGKRLWSSGLPALISFRRSRCHLLERQCFYLSPCLKTGESLKTTEVLPTSLYR